MSLIWSKLAWMAPATSRNSRNRLRRDLGGGGDDSGGGGGGAPSEVGNGSGVIEDLPVINWEG